MAVDHSHPPPSIALRTSQGAAQRCGIIVADRDKNKAETPTAANARLEALSTARAIATVGPRHKRKNAASGRRRRLLSRTS
jgi:hypothetical protein